MEEQPFAHRLSGRRRLSARFLVGTGNVVRALSCTIWIWSSDSIPSSLRNNAFMAWMLLMFDLFVGGSKK